VRGEEPQDGVGYRAGLLLRCEVVELQRLLDGIDARRRALDQQ